MICLRCGHCCENYWVVIVDDPSIGPELTNLKCIGQKGPERCQHLVGDTPGEFSCAVHDEPWYEETPCAGHGQIERSSKDECRMGRHILGLNASC